MRAMLLEFPDDRACDPLDRQYMLGQKLLVAPVLDHSGEVEYYLPKGRWTHLLSNDVFEGGSWFKKQYDFMNLPLFARPNSLVIWGDNDQVPTYDYADDALYVLYELEEGQTADALVYAEGGVLIQKISVARVENSLHIKAMDESRPWQIRLNNIASISKADSEIQSHSSPEGVILEGKGAAIIHLQ